MKDNFKHEVESTKEVNTSHQINQLRDSISILRLSNRELLLSFLQRERDYQDETIINYETNITKVTPSIGNSRAGYMSNKINSSPLLRLSAKPSTKSLVLVNKCG